MDVSGIFRGLRGGGSQIVCRVLVTCCLALCAPVPMMKECVCTRGCVFVTEASAQQAQRLAIDAPRLVEAAPVSSVSLAIRIAPVNSLSSRSFVRIRGLPHTVTLSDGFSIAPGAWAVPLVALDSLTIVVPAGTEGRFDVSINLVEIDGSVQAEAKTVLAIAQRPTSVALSLPLPIPAPVEDEERLMRLHSKGQDRLNSGNIDAARKFFERASEGGLAKSALALAETYDPTMLAKLTVIGLQPEPETARKWYARARELGSTEASERLRRFEANEHKFNR